MASRAVWWEEARVGYSSGSLQVLNERDREDVNERKRACNEAAVDGRLRWVCLHSIPRAADAEVWTANMGVRRKRHTDQATITINRVNLRAQANSAQLRSAPFVIFVLSSGLAEVFSSTAMSEASHPFGNALRFPPVEEYRKRKVALISGTRHLSFRW